MFYLILFNFPPNFFRSIERKVLIYGEDHINGDPFRTAAVKKFWHVSDGSDNSKADNCLQKKNETVLARQDPIIFYLIVLYTESTVIDSYQDRFYSLPAQLKINLLRCLTFTLSSSLRKNMGNSHM